MRWTLLIGIIVAVVFLILVVVVVVVLLLVLRKKKPEEQEDEEQPPESPELSPDEQQAQEFADNVGEPTAVDSPYAGAETASPGWDSAEQAPEYGQSLELERPMEQPMEELAQEQPQELEVQSEAAPELEQETPAELGTGDALICPTCGGALTAHGEGNWCEVCQAWH